MAKLVEHVDRVLTWGLAVAALTMAAVVVTRALKPAAPARPPDNVAGPLAASDWQEVLAESRPLTDTTGMVQLVEFTDLECPACRSFHRTTLPELMQRLGSNLTIRLVHFPLHSHRFAVPAGRAAECAARQGRFPQFVELVFGKQDSLGLKQFESYARDAGVRNLVAFRQCLTDSTSMRAVASGRRLGERLKVSGTPWIVVNGWRPRNRSLEELERVLTAFREGRQPSP